MSHPDQPADQPPRARGSAPLPSSSPEAPAGDQSPEAAGESPSAPPDGGWSPPQAPGQVPPPPPPASDWSPPSAPPAGGTGPAFNQPGYPMAMEPPDFGATVPGTPGQPGQPGPPTMPGQPGLGQPPVPGQSGGGHDSMGAPGFAPGGAPIPPPGDPWQQQPAVQPTRAARGSRVGLLLTSIAAALLLVVSGVMGFLWWSTASELDDTRTQLTAEVDELNETLEARDGEIGQLGDDLQETRDALDDAETQLEGTANLVEDLEDEKEVIRDCIVLLGEIAAREEANESVPSSMRDDADEVCDEANGILGF